MLKEYPPPSTTIYLRSRLLSCIASVDNVVPTTTVRGQKSARPMSPVILPHLRPGPVGCPVGTASYCSSLFNVPAGLLFFDQEMLITYPNDKEQKGAKKSAL